MLGGDALTYSLFDQHLPDRNSAPDRFAGWRGLLNALGGISWTSSQLKSFATFEVRDSTLAVLADRLHELRAAVLESSVLCDWILHHEPWVSKPEKRVSTALDVSYRYLMSDEVSNGIHHAKFSGVLFRDML